MAKKKESGKKVTVPRQRLFATILYEESAKENWLQILKDEHIPCFVSPYHDRDISADGTPKKPHYHIFFVFEGVKSIEQVRAIVDKISGVGVECIHSLRSYARYLCHLDDYDKAQYSTENVISLGGLNYFDAINTVLDRYNSIKEMISFCTENNISNFAELSIYASVYKFEWFRVLCDSGAVFMREFLRGVKYMSTKKPIEVLHELPPMEAEQLNFDK